MVAKDLDLHHHLFKDTRTSEVPRNLTLTSKHFFSGLGPRDRARRDCVDQGPSSSIGTSRQAQQKYNVQSTEQRKGEAAAGGSVLHSFAAPGPVKARLANALQRPSTGIVDVTIGTPQKEQHSLPWAGKAAFPDIGKCGSLGLRRYLPIMHRTLLLFLLIRIGIADSILHDCVCMAWDSSESVNSACSMVDLSCTSELMRVRNGAL
ncbi:hypothetical protein M436DRAFT_63958 [Aureobasidium namibiae CBS 147.97]|uniref:Uncharacterized protein n=1 Tax=Aureobasidium namibiae CBS 147.97 TaxID=1043004 RepID=A0A074XDS5_9PEZI|nr:uncharacterized protein M436DRAFT_63958 [Aureobasidium namibiae CBS 147.97]KEQ72776.1 hypothetical protein M436DRAFT_63958 [Aureobasidium namibiae CBS 147.97]